METLRRAGQDLLFTTDKPKWQEAEELLTRENVSFLAGTFLSNVGLAVADFANQRKTLFIATEPLTDTITMAQGNRYTFRVRPSTYMQTKMLVEAVKAKGVKK